MSSTLHRRVRTVRSRAAVRAWEYRQRHGAKGVWFRLRRTLADAEKAFAIPCSQAELLEHEGYTREPAGAELEPPKLLIFVPAERLQRIPDKRELRVALDADFLAAPCIALVRFRTQSS